MKIILRNILKFLFGRIKRKLFDLFVYARWYRKNNNKICEKYNIFVESKDFSMQGVVQIDKNYKSFSEHIYNNYVVPIEAGNNPSNKIYTNANQENKNVDIQAFLTLNDPEIQNFLFDERLVALLKTYYGSDYYLRENPLLQKITPTEENILAYRYHTDRFHQVSLMLFLSDVTENDTHMEYLCGSHKRNIFEVIHITPDDCEMQVNNFEKKLLTGIKGDAYLFDSIGIHRAKYILGKMRNVVFFNFTPGHNLYSYKDSKIILSEQSEESNILLRESSSTCFVNEAKPSLTYF